MEKVLFKAFDESHNFSFMKTLVIFVMDAENKDKSSDTHASDCFIFTQLLPQSQAVG
jgi:hypothetical protein